MKNYRIQKLSYGDYVRYVPQKKVLGLFWWNVFNDDFTQYHSYESANRALCSHLKGLVVENLDVNCGELPFETTILIDEKDLRDVK